jgi:hypothetical protein
LAATLHASAHDGVPDVGVAQLVPQSTRAARHVARAPRVVSMHALRHWSSPAVQLCMHATSDVRACIAHIARPCAQASRHC